MSFENGKFAHEMTDMSLQIEACLWCVLYESLFVGSRWCRTWDSSRNICL